MEAMLVEILMIDVLLAYTKMYITSSLALRLYS